MYITTIGYYKFGKHQIFEKKNFENEQISISSKALEVQISSPMASMLYCKTIKMYRKQNRKVANVRLVNLSFLTRCRTVIKEVIRRISGHLKTYRLSAFSKPRPLLLDFASDIGEAIQSAFLPLKAQASLENHFGPISHGIDSSSQHLAAVLGITVRSARSTKSEIGKRNLENCHTHGTFQRKRAHFIRIFKSYPKKRSPETLQNTIKWMWVL